MEIPSGADDYKSIIDHASLLCNFFRRNLLRRNLFRRNLFRWSASIPAGDGDRRSLLTPQL
jgi:hypothetical protein